jgi:kinesin family member 15
MSSAIRVAVRIRPESETEGDEKYGHTAVSVSEGNKLSLWRQKGTNQSISHSYSFDKVFEPSSTQEEVFTNVRDLIDDGLKGYNTTIFAFGMTGSGKTHTISGPSATDANAGIVPRTVHHVFSSLRKQASQQRDYGAMVFLTFTELYNNTFYDLLASSIPADDTYNEYQSSAKVLCSANPGALKLQEHPVRGMQLVGSPTLRLPVTSAEETLQLINRGYKLRATASTNLNDRSSRSHTVLSLEVVSNTMVSNEEGNPLEAGKAITHVGKINLVDLAGSERVKVSGAVGQTLEEAKQINKALSVLGDVLNSLSKLHSHSDSPTKVPPEESSESRHKAKGATESPLPRKFNKLSHVPYRNSKLTMLLKDSLGGNAKTMMIATIRPGSSFYQQSLTSLQYAARARHIKCTPILNVGDVRDNSEFGPSMQKTLTEVSRLKVQLENRNKEFNDLQKRLRALEESHTQGLLSGNTVAQKCPVDDKEKEDLRAEKERVNLEKTLLIEEYQRQIEEMQVASISERKQLQQAMKFVIHNHEGHLADKEKGFMELESRLHREQAISEHLNRDKDDALATLRMTEMKNKELYEENILLIQKIKQLKMEVSVLRKSLQEATDQAASVEMSNADREQFVEALQKLTISRGKHKSRADILESEVTSLKEEREVLHKTMTSHNEKCTEFHKAIIQKDSELNVLRLKTDEQDKLLLRAAAKLKKLEERRVYLEAQLGYEEREGEDDLPLPPRMRGTTGPESPTQASGRAASASAIVIASTEASASEISAMQSQLDFATAELEEYRANMEAALHRLRAENETLQDNVTQHKSKMEDFETEKAELIERIGDMKEEISFLEDAKTEAMGESADIVEERDNLRILLDGAHESQKVQQELLTANTKDLGEIQDKCKSYETSIKDMMLAIAKLDGTLKEEREKYESELSVQTEIQKQLKESNVHLQTQLENATNQVREAEEKALLLEEDIKAISQKREAEEAQQQQQEEIVVDKDNNENADSLNAQLSPSSENKILKNKLDQLQEHDKQMFSTLENKLKELDDAKTKLVRLRAVASEQRTKKMAYRFSEEDEEEIVGEYKRQVALLTSSLTATQKKYQSTNIELIDTKQANRELQIRLQSSDKMLEQERDLSRERLEELHELRRSTEDQISKMASLVKKSVSEGQERRLHEYTHLSDLSTHMDTFSQPMHEHHSVHKETHTTNILDGDHVVNQSVNSSLSVSPDNTRKNVVFTDALQDD